ncbi:CaiB/BaiF CoA transferase family protein [Roseibium alexandrii]|uniref:Putative acyl-CoA transferase/carnitine dehydratase n=1 Tax=Roseibium alexandrii (strain DSM 17067 / NCIMB 14079 / DFL-11) TaxID=244592 RepID=A0A5E8GZG5_ROSAD|nr:CaiB/BaiF CoA-transferase family protein [Roseibium alexandrii]EEE45561.2 putative acyl-CoA transferase/carnitine dehydratase [Roseibium alexandrii DFL-11]
MGPLHGVKIVEFAGIGPGPYGCMMLADMGAEILRIDREPTGASDIEGIDEQWKNSVARGRKSITLDLKDPAAVETALKLIEKADAVVEGFRPGVMERLGLGPDVCLGRNPALVYARMTGWGQTGPLAHAAGHDMNYISLSGALWSFGEDGRDPVPPLNLLGDYGGGGMFLAFGIVCALMRALNTGEGDVIDAAISDGTAALMAPVYMWLANNRWQNQRASNRLDGTAPYYGVYKCSDGKWVSIAPIEEKFWQLFLHLLKLDEADIGDRHDTRQWPDIRRWFESIIGAHPRDHWCQLFEGTDICFAPILDLEEAPAHAHNAARETFVERDGIVQPAPAPRFQNAKATLPSRPPLIGEHNESVLQDWGVTGEDAPVLRNSSAI